MKSRPHLKGAFKAWREQVSEANLDSTKMGVEMIVERCCTAAMARNVALWFFLEGALSLAWHAWLGAGTSRHE